jgi:hypothetical protein
MAPEQTSIPLADITKENISLKPKCQAILSIIAHFHQNKKDIQRAHLIRVLVKQPDQSSDDKNIIEKDTIDRLQVLGDIHPKVMFNSIANLDKKLKKLRKLGLITNQFMRGYPRIILTNKGRMFFYSCLYSSLIFKTITELINKFH